MIKAVLDANVFVSAVLKPASNPGRILDLVRNGSIRLYVAPKILEELRTTLLYPRLRKLHRKSPEWISKFIRELSSLAEMMPGKISVSVIEEDPSDNIYLACAAEGRVDFIVSGDKHLLKLEEYQGISIVNPADFLDAIF